jgi:nucleoside-diphosphate-sugar epimerase
LLVPAVKGVEHVLAAADAAGSVQRVVMTSSVGAVVGDHWERGRRHVFTEADWNTTATATFLPYHRWGSWLVPAGMYCLRSSWYFGA